MEKRYTHVLFDFDGTLADSSVLLIDIIEELSQKHNLGSFSIKDFQNYRELSLGKKAKILPLLMKLKPEITTLYGQGIHKLNFFEGIGTVLTYLHGQGSVVSILSSNEAGNIERFLGTQGLSFAIPVYSSQGFFGKHSALKRFMKEHNCTSKDILYVGDEIRDIEACAKVGIDIAFVGWGLDGKADISRYPVQYRVKAPEELLDIVLE